MSYLDSRQALRLGIPLLASALYGHQALAQTVATAAAPPTPSVATAAATATPSVATAAAPPSAVLPPAAPVITAVVPPAAPVVPAVIDTPASALELLPVTPAAAGGLTAEDVATRALSVSPQARSAKAQASRMTEQADDAYSLFLPRVNLNASYTRLSNVPNSIFGRINFPDQFSLKASISIPVSEYFLSLKDHYNSAQQLELVGRLQQEGEQQAVVHDAKRAYFELAGTVAARNLAQLRVEQLSEFTAEVSALVEGGERSRVELSQAQAKVALAQAGLQSAIASHHIAAQTLLQFLEMPVDGTVAIGEPLLEQLPNIPTDIAALYRNADANRAEIRALRGLIAAHKDTASARAGARYPSLALFGNINYDNPNQRLFPQEERFYATWALGAQLSWSPTDLAVRSSELKDARLEVVKAQEQLRALRARVVIEVTTAYEQAVAARGNVKAAAASVTASEQAYEARRSLFHAGEATSREVLQADLDLRTSQLQYVHNMLSAHLAQSSLEHATGGLHSPNAGPRAKH